MKNLEIKSNFLNFQIFEALKTKSRFHIDHTVIAGSVGKGTAIIDSDIDGILFLNDEHPLFSDVLNEWEDIFTLTDALDVQNVRKTKYSIQFTSKTYEFDFLPAPNFVNIPNLAGEERIKIQQQKTLEKISENPKKYSYLYSAALAESVLQFIRKQERFVNEMIRIVKFWYKTLYIPEYVSGAKQLIELVTVHAAHIERLGGAPTNKMYLRTFGRVLDYIIKFDSIHVIFNDEYNSQFKSVARTMGSARPCVLDPANPYNNLAKNFVDKPNMKDSLIGYARETKDRLYQLLDGRRQMNVDAIAFVFAPQPQIIPNIPENILNAQFMVGASTNVVRFPDKTIRNERLRTDRVLLQFFDLFQLRLMILMESYKANETVTLDDSKVIMEQLINRNIYGHDRQWIRSTASHEEYEITFTIPFGNRGSVQISLKNLYN